MNLQSSMVHLIPLIRKSETIILTTHRQCDGDGLGAELAVYYGLKKMGKKVRVINVDRTPRKYHFLKTDDIVSYFEEWVKPEELSADLALIFDTNDSRLLPGFYSYLEKNVEKIVFIDHHPILKSGPKPTEDSIIDTSAASTGELAFNLLEGLGVPLDRDIARCLYTSIVFDTQLFRFIRNSPRTHEIAAMLLKLPIDAMEIHRGLFGNQTVQKMAFVAKALSQIEYQREGRIAISRIQRSDLLQFGLDIEESRDVIDMIMNIDSLEIAVMIREDAPNEFKVSLRSKGTYELVAAAEKLGGGGHVFSAGAYVRMPYEKLYQQLVLDLNSLIPEAK